MGLGQPSVEGVVTVRLPRSMVERTRSRSGVAKGCSPSCSHPGVVRCSQSTSRPVPWPGHENGSAGNRGSLPDGLSSRRRIRTSVSISWLHRTSSTTGGIAIFTRRCAGSKHRSSWAGGSSRSITQPRSAPLTPVMRCTTDSRSLWRLRQFAPRHARSAKGAPTGSTSGRSAADLACCGHARSISPWAMGVDQGMPAGCCHRGRSRRRRSHAESVASLYCSLTVSRRIREQSGTARRSRLRSAVRTPIQAPWCLS